MPDDILNFEYDDTVEGTAMEQFEKIVLGAGLRRRTDPDPNAITRVKIQKPDDMISDTKESLNKDMNSVLRLLLSDNTATINHTPTNYEGRLFEREQITWTFTQKIKTKDPRVYSFLWGLAASGRFKDSAGELAQVFGRSNMFEKVFDDNSDRYELTITSATTQHPYGLHVYVITLSKVNPKKGAKNTTLLSLQIEKGVPYIKTFDRHNVIFRHYREADNYRYTSTAGSMMIWCDDSTIVHNAGFGAAYSTLAKEQAAVRTLFHVLLECGFHEYRPSPPTPATHEPEKTPGLVGRKNVEITVLNRPPP